MSCGKTAIVPCTGAEAALPPVFSTGIILATAFGPPDLSSIAASYAGLGWHTCQQQRILYLIAPNNLESATIIISDTAQDAVNGVFSASCAEPCGRPESCPCTPCAPDISCPMEYGAQFVATLISICAGPVESSPTFEELNGICAPITGDGCAILPTTVLTVPITQNTLCNTKLGFPYTSGQPRQDGAVLYRSFAYLTLVLPNTTPWLPCNASTNPNTSLAAFAFRCLLGAC